MSDKTTTAHDWGPVVSEGSVHRWLCLRCSLEVVAPAGAVPYASVKGRVVNGRIASRYYMLPSCRVAAPQPPTTHREPKPRHLRDHELRTCYTALGRDWVNQTIGPPRYDEEGDPDLDWEVGLLQLYSAVNVLNLDATDLVPLVRERMAERLRNQVIARGTHYGASKSQVGPKALGKKIL